MELTTSSCTQSPKMSKTRGIPFSFNFKMGVPKQHATKHDKQCNLLQCYRMEILTGASQNLAYNVYKKVSMDITGVSMVNARH